ncbi:hypothetical protein Tco_0731353 [Tanacetum coccineum]
MDDLDTMSLDDVYNHLKVYEPEVAFDLLRDALSAIFGLSELKGKRSIAWDARDALGYIWIARFKDLVFHLRILRGGPPDSCWEDAPCFPEYVPEGHVPVYMMALEHPEDTLPRWRDVASAYYLTTPSGNPTIVTIPYLHHPTSRRVIFRPGADASPRTKRLLLTTPDLGVRLGIVFHK